MIICVFDFAVLIETYWNVKSSEKKTCSKECESINRNILECKVYSPFSSKIPAHCINRNILECKVDKPSPEKTRYTY